MVNACAYKVIYSLLTSIELTMMMLNVYRETVSLNHGQPKVSHSVCIKRDELLKKVLKML